MASRAGNVFFNWLHLCLSLCIFIYRYMYYLWITVSTPLRSALTHWTLSLSLSLYIYIYLYITLSAVELLQSPHPLSLHPILSRYFFICSFICSSIGALSVLLRSRERERERGRAESFRKGEMPLVRVQVRNEFGLGQPELYREVDREDSKAVLDGVAVAGLVGILRQLGHLVEFAVEVFHGLQEQVMSTSSRSHKLMVRIQRIEAALPPLEKAMLAQKRHLRFAYATGSDWHALLQDEQNHFIYGDLPQFIMDSYEECCDQPRLHLLDKFDTGGPGSCLKRYSDPTFFRNASASFEEVNAKKVSKDREACRSKKSTWQRNEMSHGESISNHTGRIRLASLKVDEQISPPLTVSTFDGTLKSDLANQSNSFDLRSGSGYIECVFHPSDSVKPEEHEPRESSFSILRMQQNDTLDSASFDEHRVVDVDFSRNLLQGETGPSSSCVTWDEKTQIIESWDHQYDHDVTSEVLTTNVDIDRQEKGTVNFRNVGQQEFQFGNKDTPTSISGQNQLDDIESEPGNYMDACNIIGSESETDLDCQMKQQVERSSTFNDDRKQDGMQGFMSHHSDLQSSNLESLTASHNSSNNVTFFDKPDFISSESFPQKGSPQMVTEYSDIGNSPGMDVSGNNEVIDGSREESDVSNFVYSGSADPNPQALRSDKIISTSESQKSPTELSAIRAVKCWTNGGLLGLEPSKPPDFSVSNAVSQDSVTRSEDDTACSSSQNIILNCDGHVEKPDKLVQNSKKIEKFSSKFSASCHTDQDGMSNKKTSWRFFPTELGAKHEKCGDSHRTNRFYGNVGDSLNESSAVPEAELAANPDVKAVCSKAGQTAGENACPMLGLSNRFLVNCSQKNGALVHDGKSELPASRKSDVSVQKSRKQSVAYRTVSERNFKGYHGSWSPITSPPSPPLKHMKISFQHINGFETSKIKLKFPDGSYFHDNIRDTLPSFQLVPEPATPQHDIGSVPDDDTSCRSSPYMSDDCLSHNSESNSEQWESDDSPPSKDKELYDALRRISLTESVSSSLEPEGTGHGNIPAEFGLQRPYNENCMELCRSGHSLDLPSFSTLNPLFEQEMKKGSDGKGFPESQFQKEPAPLPPLPPLQWRVMKHHSSDATMGTMGKEDSVSEALSYAFDMKVLGSVISPQSKLGPVKQQQNADVAAAFAPKDKQSEWQKSSGNKEVNKAKKGKEINEMENFLQQIRTKSFSLRRAVAEKPTVTPGPIADVKITAILQKADAVRQAVANDGEDDSWSDI